MPITKPRQITSAQFEDVRSLINYVLDGQSEYRDFVEWLCEQGSPALKDKELDELRELKWNDERMDTLVERAALHPKAAHAYACAVRLLETLIDA